MFAAATGTSSDEAVRTIEGGYGEESLRYELELRILKDF